MRLMFWAPTSGTSVRNSLQQAVDTTNQAEIASEPKLRAGWLILTVYSEARSYLPQEGGLPRPGKWQQVKALELDEQYLAQSLRRRAPPRLSVDCSGIGPKRSICQARRCSRPSNAHASCTPSICRMSGAWGGYIRGGKRRGRSNR